MEQLCQDGLGVSFWFDQKEGRKKEGKEIKKQEEMRLEVEMKDIPPHLKIVYILNWFYGTDPPPFGAAPITCTFIAVITNN